MVKTNENIIYIWKTACYVMFLKVQLSFEVSSHLSFAAIIY